MIVNGLILKILSFLIIITLLFTKKVHARKLDGGQVKRCPPCKAREFPGKTKKGVDGTMYVSTLDKAGRYRWVKKRKGNARRTSK